MSVSRLVCAGCGAEPARDDPFPFACPNAGRGDDVDHVLRRELDLAAVEFPAGGGEANPFVRYRGLLHAYHVAREGGISDEEFVALVRTLDERVAAVDGHGFRVTPFARADKLSDELGVELWVKDETGNVSGSHKARHLFGSSSGSRRRSGSASPTRRRGPTSRSRAAETPRWRPPSSPRRAAAGSASSSPSTPTPP